MVTNRTQVFKSTLYDLSSLVTRDLRGFIENKKYRALLKIRRYCSLKNQSTLFSDVHLKKMQDFCEMQSPNFIDVELRS